MTSVNLEAFTLREVATAIANGEISCVEATQACIDRAQLVQPTLNCFIHLDAEGALEKATAADKVLRSGENVGPLHGVPMAHKDAFYRRGRITTCGSAIRATFVPETTATVLERLDAAGAIELGTLHLGEFAASGTGHNAFFGNCRNPWNTDYTPGGSSSGSAVAVASRVAFASLGTDTSGSLRWPAFLCGVVALRPTKGSVSGYGVLARSWTIDAVGPMARTVADVGAVYSVIAGYDPMDPEATRRPVPDVMETLSADLKGLRIGIPKNYFYDGVAFEVRKGLDESLRVFEHLGATLIPVSVPDPSIASTMADLIVKCESSAIHQRWLLDRPKDYSQSVRNQMLPGFFVPAPSYIQALRLRHSQLLELMGSTFNEVDMLHIPGAPVSPPTLEKMDLQTEDEVRNFWSTVPKCTRPISYWGVPALSVPCGLSASRMPIGFQLVGPPHSENILLRAGHAYQAETDWHHEEPPVPTQRAL